MKQYSYVAKSKENNKEISGVLEASSEKELKDILRKNNLFLIEIKEKKSKNIFSISLFDRVSLIDKIFFTKNLQVMLSGGLSLSRALQVLSMQAKRKNFKNIISDIRKEISSGKSFSQSLSKYPDTFSEIFRSMIQLSEETGRMEENLAILTNQLEKEYELKSRVKGALVYPSVIVSAMVGIGILMLILVVPEMARTFENLGIDLPFTTQFIIKIGNFLANSWFLIPPFIVLFIYTIKLISKTKKGKIIVDFFYLKIPIVSLVVKKTNAAYTARTLSSLLSSGVSIIRGLEIISESLQNSYFKKSILESIEAMKKGEKLSQALKPYSELYSLLMVHMIEVGEETGQTSKVLSRTSEFLEEEIFNLTKNLTSIIEPILMIVVGAAIGFFAIAMIQPMYSMIGTL